MKTPMKIQGKLLKSTRKEIGVTDYLFISSGMKILPCL